MSTALIMESVTKTYRLGKINSGYLFTEVQQAVDNTLLCLRGRPVKKGPPGKVVHALDGIFLEAAEGEAVGIVGPNGSGKSTLLRLCAGITLPSEGRILLHGRVASLLDIGVGFQSDLSARENIFLNGAILGMTRREILAAFDDIVAFSGIGRFLDTPVKRFSTGMYIRLAFSIAIHCVADILLIDEILAAADRCFLDQCRDKLIGYIAQGKTILLVSHNLDTIEGLCGRTVLLDRGCIAMEGPTPQVLDRYRKMVLPVRNDDYGSDNG
jgi:lipopolysaccharide transport system ATP-binding protein